MKQIKKIHTGIQFIVASAVLMSFSPVFFKISEAAPATGAFYRVFFGGIVLLSIALIKREKLFEGRKQFFYVFLAGTFFAVDIYVWHESIIYAGASLATLLGNFQVFILAAYGVIVLHEKLTWRLIVPVPLALVGIAMITGFEWGGLSGDMKLGIMYGMFTALSFAAYLLCVRQTRKVKDPLPAVSNMAQISLTSALILFVMIPFSGMSLEIVSFKSFINLAAYGVICQAGAQLLVSIGLGKTKASVSGILILLQPALVYVWDIVIFSKPVYLLEFAGFVLTLFAVYLGVPKKNNTN